MDALRTVSKEKDRSSNAHEAIVRKLARAPISALWAQNDAVVREVVAVFSEKQLRDIAGIVGQGIQILHRNNAPDLGNSFRRSCALLLGTINSEVSDTDFLDFRQLLIDQDIWLSIPAGKKREVKKDDDAELAFPRVLERYRVPRGPIRDVQKLPLLFPGIPNLQSSEITKLLTEPQVAQLMKGFEFIYEFTQLPIILDTFGPREDKQRRAFRERLEKEDEDAYALYENNALRIVKISAVFTGVENLYIALGRLPGNEDRAAEAFKVLDSKIAEVRQLWKTEEIPVEEKLVYVNTSLLPYLLNTWNEVRDTFTSESKRDSKRVA